jgi:7-cyano-7-deazaguanine synthase
MKKVLVYSGGLDSTVALYSLAAQHAEIIAMSFDYGQLHHKELGQAVEICDRLKETGAKVTHFFKSVRDIFDGVGCALLDPAIDVPDGHYTDESMKATVVPNRNMIMLAMATSTAMSVGAEAVVIGAHAGDHAIYADCQPSFIMAMAAAMLNASDDKVRLEAPFLFMTKKDIVMLGAGARLRVPFELTWSCYKGAKYHCGTCGTCVERKEAFQHADVEDPTLYETPYFEGTKRTDG